MGWVAEDKFCGESTDGDVSAADSVKKGGVGRGAEGAGNIFGEGSVFKVRDRGCSGVLLKNEYVKLEVANQNL